jgi:hypothetical protein
VLNKNRGCKKCDYTGFAYAKIPCVCQDKPSFVEDQPIKEICGVVPFYFTSNKLPEIKAGDLVAVGDTVIGRALSPTEADGTVNIAIDSIVYGSALKEQPIQMTVRVNARDLVVIHE